MVSNSESSVNLKSLVRRSCNEKQRSFRVKQCTHVEVEYQRSGLTDVVRGAKIYLNDDKTWKLVVSVVKGTERVIIRIFCIVKLQRRRWKISSTVNALGSSWMWTRRTTEYLSRELPKNGKLILGERRDGSRSKFTAEVESSKSRGGENFANVLLEYAMRVLYQR